MPLHHCKQTIMAFSSASQEESWDLHGKNFLLPYITVEEYFIICFTFIFNLYFLCFVVDELPAFIVILNNF